MTLGRSSLPIENQKLIIAFSSLPGIGPKTAQRLTFYILSQSVDETLKLSEALKDVKKNLSYCQCCFFITSEENINTCNFCHEKESPSICVVENIVDAITIDMSGIHSGTYHILHGSISPMNGIGPENLKIDALINRINTESPEEIILATNPTLEGEATSMYLSNFIKENYKNIKITKLAKGLASGTDLEFSDFNTLSNAFENRTDMN